MESQNIISVDIGGTFTDSFVTLDGRTVTGKAPTTHYNLSVGFLKSVADAASKIKLNPKELLGKTDLVIYSTTIATNTLLQRSGPKLGLITTKGFEDTIFIGRSRQWADGLPVSAQRGVNYAKLKKPEPLIPKEMVVGVPERVDCFGKVVMPLRPGEVRTALQYLVDKGARGFVISLLWSHVNSVHEQMVRRIIEEEYPEYYLGSMPIVLSSEVLPKRNEYPRTMAAILNAYLHRDAADSLNDLGDELKQAGYTNPLLIVHNSGGMAKVSRTMAYQLYGAGPVAGLLGGVYIAEVYGYRDLVLTDMGGTSFDLGLVTDGKASSYEFRPIIDRWLVELSILETVSIGVGGGSVSWINYAFGNKLEVGPGSAGSMPGPACYDLGGTEPTITDADALLGYIDPSYFLAGRMKLNKEKAKKAIEEKIAKPLGMDVMEAARSIRDIADATMGQAVYKETALKGYNPKDLTLLAYGGAGPTHCCSFSRHIGVKRIMAFPFSPVFCAFGASTMNILHTYEKGRRIVLSTPYSKEYLKDYEEFNSVVEGLQRRALRDMRGEGFEPDRVIFSLELDMKWGTQLNTTRISSPRLALRREEDAREVCRAFEESYVLLYSKAAAYQEGGIEVEGFLLKAMVPTVKPQLPIYDLDGEDASKAFKGQRDVYWQDGFESTPVYERSRLKHGNRMRGPAIVEAEDTTLVLNEGYRLTVDQHLSCVIERE